MDEINELQGKYNGERIFVLGNGPSINKTPLRELNSEYTLAMNNINKIYSETDWRPSFYYLPQPPSNPQTPDTFEGDNYIYENIKLDIPCFIESAYSDLLGRKENVMYFDKLELWGINPFDKADQSGIADMDIDHLKKYWSDDISDFLFHYHAMYGALQIASYMGFDQIYLLGCDLGLKYRNPHMIFGDGLDPHRFKGSKLEYLQQSYKNGNIIQSLINAMAMKLLKSISTKSILKENSQGETEDHFVPDYYAGMQISDGPKNEKEMVKSHIAAKRILESKGKSIYNATIGGELEVYDRVNIEEII